CSIASSHKLDCKFEGLEPSTEYEVSVSSCVARKEIFVCSEEVVASGWTKPNTPKSVTVNPRTSSSLDVVVVAPSDASGISRYEAFVVRDPSKACTITSLDKPECQLEGLEAGTVYVVKVKACVSNTDPPVCSRHRRVLGWTKPNAPTSVRVIPDTASSIMVEFEAPSDAKGITNYEVSLVGAD
uniref:Fibronectin type-III domain-containing protein n=1 Tax=Mesocestoides corti TaxID=53468 RepID=A0A5K3G294_MESCO